MAKSAKQFVSAWPLWYVGATAVLIATFFLLHHTANLLPQERALAFVQQAFKAGNLITESDYPFKIYGRQSVRSLIGQNLYADCASLASLIGAPSSRKFEDMVLPKSQESVIKAPGRYARHCFQLHRIAVEGADFELLNLKTRYWQGSRALLGNALYWKQLSLFHVNTWLKLMTLFAWLVLALVSLNCSRRLFLAVFPVVVAGFFFSGVPYYGGVSHSIPCLFSIIALAVLVSLMKRGSSSHALSFFFFVTGLLSAYLFLLDGHLLLLLPLSAVILYFGAAPETRFRCWLSRVFYCMVSFLSGFTVSYAANQIAKVYFLGFQEQMMDIAENLSLRMRPVLWAPIDQGGGVESITSLHDLLYTLRVYDFAAYLVYSVREGFLGIGALGNQDLFYLLLFGSGIALLVALAVTVWRRCKRKEIAAILPVAVILIASAMVFARILMFIPHTMEHYDLIGHYMFVPLGLCWSALFVALLVGAKAQISSKNERQARLQP